MAFQALTAKQTWRSYNQFLVRAGHQKGPVMTDPQSVRSKHCEQSRYYRDRASAIRARLPTLQEEEVYNELYLLAAHYERLAEFADSSGSLGPLGDLTP
jgi:hypothetical protein